MDVNRNIRTNKGLILSYFRDRSTEFLAEVNSEFGNTQYKEKARRLNTLLVKAKIILIEIITNIRGLYPSSRF